MEPLVRDGSARVFVDASSFVTISACTLGYPHGQGPILQLDYLSYSNVGFLLPFSARLWDCGDVSGFGLERSKRYGDCLIPQAAYFYCSPL